MKKKRRGRPAREYGPRWCVRDGERARFNPIAPYGQRFSCKCGWRGELPDR